MIILATLLSRYFQKKKDSVTSLKVTGSRCIQNCTISVDQVLLSAPNYEYVFTVKLSVLGMLLSRFVHEINVNRW